MISSSSILGGRCGKQCEVVSLAGSETRIQAEVYLYFFLMSRSLGMVGGRGCPDPSRKDSSLPDVNLPMLPLNPHC